MRRRLRGCDLTGSIVPARGPAPGATGSVAARPDDLSVCYAVAVTLFKSNGVPSTSMRCITTASLRASATLALRMPARLATPSAQAFSHPPLTGRSRMMLAAS